MKSPWVTVWQFMDVSEALLAKGKLETAGIECILGNENMARMYGFAVGGVTLQVAPHQASDALTILQEPIPNSLQVDASSPNYMQPRCQKCGSLDVNDQGPGET